MVVSSTINKSTETLNSKFYSGVSSNTFAPFLAPNNELGDRGIRELMLDASEIELGGI